MADSILRLKVESQEYDQKIKRAAEGIQQYAQKCREVGGTLEHLDDGVLEFVQALGKMDTVATSSKQQLREMSNALTTLTTTYRGLTDEEKTSPFGQELAKGIQQLTERAGAAQDAMMDVQASIKNAASDTRAFDQIAQGMGVAMAGFQGLTGAGKLLGIEMGNDVEVIAKLQAAMAVTNSLTTIQTALQKQSALMQGVQAAQTALATAAQTVFAAATGNATTAQAAFNAVAKANPYILLATAIAAVGTALWAFSSASSDAKKKEEELAKAEEEATKKAQEQRDAFVNASASAMNTASRLSSLQVAYKQANSEIEKTNILKQAQTEFKKLGIECKGVSDAQTLLISKGAEIIELIKTQGTVAAITAIRMEKFKESFRMLMENGYSASAAASLAGYNKDVVELDGQITAMQSRIQGLKGSLGVGGNGGGSGNGTGGSVKAEDTNYAADSIMAQEKEVAKLTDAWKRASEEMRGGILKDLDAAKAKLEVMQGKVTGTGSVEGGTLGDVTVKGSVLPSITRTLRESPVNTDSINNYISQLQSALKNADLGSELSQNLSARIADANLVQDAIKRAMEGGMEGADLTTFAGKLKEMLASGDISDEFWNNLYSKFGEDLNVDTSKGTVTQKEKEEEKEDKSFQEFAKGLQTVTSGLSSVSGGLKQLGVEIPKEVDDLINIMSAVGQIISGVQAVVSVMQIPSQTANTTAVGLNTAAIGALIAAIQVNTATNFIPFATGGIVGRAASGLLVGNQMSGDNLRMPVIGGGMIGVNDGELILNKAQQGILAESLEGGGFGNLHLSAEMDTEQIIMTIDNRLGRTGYGEMVSSKNYY